MRCNVQPFPEPGSKLLVSTEGGTEPVWSRDGHELFYRDGDKMMAVATMIQPTLRASKPEVLFEKPSSFSGCVRVNTKDPNSCTCTNFGDMA